MANLIDDAERAEANSILDDVFDTFKRAIVMYQEPTKLIISQNPNFSRFGPTDQNTTQVKNDPRRFVVSGVVSHRNNTDSPLLFLPGTDASAKIKVPTSVVQIKVDSIGYDILKDAKLIELDGFLFKPQSAPRPHGLFGPTRWTFTFQNNS